ncbi:pH-response transcription factor [Smittium culicis]|uniref:pH-response transcription factor n=1 Tax=Smittium culicis TaxID=133412 RepID=A0A1R1XV28_9FUNG|nr:pH-response transcription factor [Smittium culicis]
MSKTLPCKWLDCAEAFDTDELLYSHLTSVHVGWKSTGNLNLECRWEGCCVKTAKRDHITSHLRVHLCEKSFKWIHDLKKHAKSHTSAESSSSPTKTNTKPSLPETPENTLKRSHNDDHLQTISSYNLNDDSYYKESEIDLTYKIDSISKSMKKFCSSKSLEAQEKDQFMGTLNQLLMTDPSDITELPDSLDIQDNLFYLNQGFLKLFPDFKSDSNISSALSDSSSLRSTPTLSDDSLLFDNLLSQISDKDHLDSNFLSSVSSPPDINDISYNSLLPTHLPSSSNAYSSNPTTNQLSLNHIINTPSTTDINNMYPPLSSNLNTPNMDSSNSLKTDEIINNSNHLFNTGPTTAISHNTIYQKSSNSTNISNSYLSNFNQDILSNTSILQNSTDLNCLFVPSSDIPIPGISNPASNSNLPHPPSRQNIVALNDNLYTANSELLGTASHHSSNILNDIKPNSNIIPENLNIPFNHNTNNNIQINPILTTVDNHYTIDTFMHSSTPSLPSTATNDSIYKKFLGTASSIGLNLTPNQIKRLADLEAADANARSNYNTLSKLYSSNNVSQIPNTTSVSNNYSTQISQYSQVNNQPNIYQSLLNNIQPPNNLNSNLNSFSSEVPQAQGLSFNQFISTPSQTQSIRYNNFQQPIQNLNPNTFTFKNVGIQQKSFSTLTALGDENLDKSTNNSEIPTLSNTEETPSSNDTEPELDLSKPVIEPSANSSIYSGLIDIVDDFKSLSVSNISNDSPVVNSSLPSHKQSVKGASIAAHSNTNSKSISQNGKPDSSKISSETSEDIRPLKNSDLKNETTTPNKIDPKAVFAMLARINALYLKSKAKNLPN